MGSKGGSGLSVLSGLLVLSLGRSGLSVGVPEDGAGGEELTGAPELTDIPELADIPELTGSEVRLFSLLRLSFKDIPVVSAVAKAEALLLAVGSLPEGSLTICNRQEDSTKAESTAAVKMRPFLFKPFILYILMHLSCLKILFGHFVFSSVFVLSKDEQIKGVLCRTCRKTRQACFVVSFYVMDSCYPGGQSSVIMGRGAASGAPVLKSNSKNTGFFSVSLSISGCLVRVIFPSAGL